MTTFVISHGAWGGGWEWTPVAHELRTAGHHVFTPTLTGLGERRHLGVDGVGLSDHVEDLIAVLSFEELDNVVLCGHSYSGMVITQVADRLAERIRLLVYLDAVVPHDGQALLDLMPDDLAAELRNSTKDGGIPIPSEFLPPRGSLPEERRTAYIERLGPQPAETFNEPVRLSGASDDVTRAYVRCTTDDDMAPFGDMAREAGWLCREIPTPHDLQLFDPAGVAAVLAEVSHGS
jgi:pimeloyl-ACP methyl ester carboxylesterase